MADPTVAGWLVTQATRIASRQRAQVDTAKLVVTFVAGLAATLTATALQVGRPSGLDVVAAVFLGAAVLAAVIVFVFDRLRELDHLGVLEQAHLQGWNQARLLQNLDEATVACSYFNEQIVTAVRRLALVQVVLAIVSALVAVLSLLLGGP